MFAYTKAAGKKILADIQKISLVCSITAQIFCLFYLLYALCKGVGIFYANLVLFILSCAYFGFFLYNLNFNGDKKIAAKVAYIFKWCKRLIKLFNLGIMIYAIKSTANTPSPFTIILTVVLALLWLSDILLEIAVRLIRSWFRLLIEGLQADAEIFTKPANAVGNFFKRVTGKEVQDPPPASPKRVFLNGLVQKNKAERKNLRLEKRYQKKQKKLEKEGEITALQPIDTANEIVVTSDKK